MAYAEARFGGLLEFVPDAIVLADGDGHIVLANSQAGALFGYAAGELPGMKLEQLMPARFRASHVAQRSGYQHHPQLRPMGAGRELYGLRKDGVEFPVEISLNPVRTEDGLLVMSAIRDISERRRFELALQEKMPSWPMPTWPRTASWPPCRTSCAPRSIPSSASPAPC
ncbi:PAS domain S-box protein [Massilia sp. MB5]|uniref:PAS domain S-box protein n=1 Tax=Massilia sp. MB5 TaxID=2919578 RepID=UPI001F10E363|nr:PAS domain S-box protein [Massilia sp. MB5]UMR28622.1 PAS domain S-box protein [Massilia sp. MB5]